MRQNKNNKQGSRSTNAKKPTAPKAKLISRTKYFKVGIRDSARVRMIKEGMNHLFDTRNQELEEAFLQEATQYTERVLGETRRFQFSKEEDQEIMDVIFNNTNEEEPEAMTDLAEEGAELEVEELIPGEEEERLEREADGEDDTLDSEGVIELNERIQAEDQEEYERIRAELDEEEDEANKDN